LYVVSVNDPVDTFAMSIDRMFDRNVSRASDISLMVGKRIGAKDEIRNSLTRKNCLMTIKKIIDE